MTRATSPARRRLLLAITLSVPILFFAALEGGLRLAWRDGALPVFSALDAAGTSLLVPNRGVARRYFASSANPPVPPMDAFAAEKPARSFRVFVLGESSAAGFPFPPNGTFSRVLRDALRDVLPGDSVEVVNLGIAATNSFTLVDLADDVIAQRPDVILIYAGHNEYYGALGVGSTIGMGSSPRLVRLYLAAERLRTVVMLRNGIAAVMRLMHPPPNDSTAATLMESVARDQRIELGGRAYQAGLSQYAGNLDLTLRRFRDAGVPVLVASIASNVRDQPPFVSDHNGPAFAAFDSAGLLSRAGDSSTARRLYARARDLDVIRFRAPSALNDTIRAVAAREGARYVPTAERFDAASPGGSPGHELFLEHVHPNRHGYALMAQTFFEALRDMRFLGRDAHLERLSPWPVYEARMELTPFDERIAEHTVRTITSRWPFVPRERALDYRGTYRPGGLSDSLALLVSRGGISWAEAKLRVAADEETRGHADSAFAEYRGLIRDRPFTELPYRFAGRALVAAHRPSDAAVYLERSLSMAPTPEATYLLGILALQQKDYARAITLLDRAVTMAPTSAAAAYQLSLAFGLSRNLDAARAAAARAAQVDPRYPGLARWMVSLGMAAP
jgi:tetratricopeptide (TPR) repeat protein